MINWFYAFLTYLLQAIIVAASIMLDLAVAIPTFIGSFLSMLAAGFIFMCYVVLPSQKHFRHTLILNLACAGTFSSLEIS